MSWRNEENGEVPGLNSEVNDLHGLQKLQTETILRSGGNRPKVPGYPKRSGWNRPWQNRFSPLSPFLISFVPVTDHHADPVRLSNFRPPLPPLFHPLDQNNPSLPPLASLCSQTKGVIPKSKVAIRQSSDLENHCSLTACAHTHTHTHTHTPEAVAIPRGVWRSRKGLFL